MFLFPKWALAAAILAALARADSSMTPDYEVKLLMDPAVVLGSNHKLEATVLSAFVMPTSVTKMNVQFLDTDDQEIYGALWSPRIRKTEIEDGFELTYKKRYPVAGDDIDATLSTANTEGFDAGDTSYDAQIEWGYQNQTLSISRKKRESRTGFRGTDLPGAGESRDMLIHATPGKFDDWKFRHWGTEALKDSRVYGPVLARRSVGTWNATELFIEVWPIRNAAGTGIEHIVEASFKTASRATAAAKRDSLISFLQGKGWFLARDSLKTQLIMDRY